MLDTLTGPAEEAELRRKFNKFAKSEGDVEHLSFPEFTRLMEHYEASSPVNLVAYFYAMDRNRDHKLDFQEPRPSGCKAGPPLNQQRVCVFSFRFP